MFHVQWFQVSTIHRSIRPTRLFDICYVESRWAMAPKLLWCIRIAVVDWFHTPFSRAECFRGRIFSRLWAGHLWTWCANMRLFIYSRCLSTDLGALRLLAVRVAAQTQPLHPFAEKTPWGNFCFCLHFSNLIGLSTNRIVSTVVA